MKNNKKVLILVILILLIISFICVEVATSNSFALKLNNTIKEATGINLQLPAALVASTGTQGTVTFTTDSIYPLNIKNIIYRLSINADINLKGGDSLVRVILVDTKGTERLVYETYPLIADSNTFSVNDICQETCVLDSITPSSLKVQIINATISLKAVNSSNVKGTSVQSVSAMMKNQELAAITKLNQKINTRGLSWTAGETSISGLSYEQKKKMFTNPDGTQVDKLPNLQGFEYYKGGVFRIPSSSPLPPRVIPIVPSLDLPSTWDWRNVDGQNWNTSVKNQGAAGNCWAFADTATLEAQINLYYNKHINLDLSEQELVDGLNTWQNDNIFNSRQCTTLYAHGKFYCITQVKGLADESCDTYKARDLSHADPSFICSDYGQRSWKNNNFNQYIFLDDPMVVSHNYSGDWLNKLYDILFQNKNEQNLEKILINKGPFVTDILSWNHAMELEGYNLTNSTSIYSDGCTSADGFSLTTGLPCTIISTQPGGPEAGKTIWIFKNSWGTDWGDGGYVKVEVPLSDLWSFTSPVGPFTPPINKAYWPVGFDNKVLPYNGVVQVVARVDKKIISSSNNGNCISNLILPSGNDTAGCVRTITNAKRGIYSLEWYSGYPNIPNIDKNVRPNITPAKILTGSSTLTFYLDFVTMPVGSSSPQALD
ncbi:MAG: C1 family peptidase [Candidatus Paceibacterota bacterium]